MFCIFRTSTTTSPSTPNYLTMSILETGPLHTRYTPYRQPPKHNICTWNKSVIFETRQT